MGGKTVLVTGGSGFIAAHCVLRLLEAGYKVRSSLRSLRREAEARAMLKAGGVDAGEAVSFVAADLMSDVGWREALAGCDFALHIASPFPASAPRHEDELVLPAREGALRVLRAARDAGVKRVVMTSSFAAIGYGQRPKDRPFSEEDWTDPEGADVSAYIKSKTLAERAAWDFVAAEGGSLELSVVNPVGVFGPVLGPDYSTSIQLVRRLMDGTMPGVPRLSFGIVDARDVADLHLRAMTDPAAKGERFLAVAGPPMTMPEIARTLSSRLGEAARLVPTKIMPNWMVRFGSLLEPSLKPLVAGLGKVKSASNEKAKRLLGWAPRSNEDALVATAESLVRFGLVPESRKAARAMKVS